MIRFLLLSKHLSLIILISIFYLDVQSAQAGRKVDKSTFIYLLKNGGYEHLNKKLEDLQKEYEADYLSEENLYDAFDAFYYADPSFQNMLNAWIREYPNFWAPYVARARYYCACAWQLQSRKWIIERRGRLYNDIENFYALAESDIKKALEKNSKLDICYAMQIEIGVVKGEEMLVKDAFYKALKNNPYSYRVRLQYLHSLSPKWGGSYQQMQSFIDSSLKLLDKNSKLNELNASIPADKGRYYYFLGKYDHSVKMFTEALNYSKSVLYFIERGDAYYGLRDFKSAKSDYEEALKISPNDPLAQERLNKMTVNKEQLARMQKMTVSSGTKVQSNIDNNESSLVDDRQKAIEHTKAASNHMRAGRYAEAIREYSRAIDLSPGEYTLFYYRGMCYKRTGNEDGALQDFLRAIELKPNESRLYLIVVEIYANKGMYDQAIDIASRAISIDPADGEAYYYRSKAYERKNSHVEALEDMRKACNLGYDRACHEYKQIVR